MSQKLLFQKNEIEKRNEMITNLQKSFEEFRINYLKEKNDNMEKAKQIQNLKQMVTELTINNEVQAKTAKFFMCFLKKI